MNFIRFGVKENPVWMKRLMRTLTNISHKFDLKGLRVDDAFLGCKNCWWRAERGEVMKPICPECGEQLYAYYVRKEDL
jgi:hypothetical protein